MVTARLRVPVRQPAGCRGVSTCIRQRSSMRCASFIIALCLTFSASILYASVDVPDCGSNLTLDFLLERAAH